VRAQLLVDRRHVGELKTPAELDAEKAEAEIRDLQQAETRSLHVVSPGWHGGGAGQRATGLPSRGCPSPNPTRRAQLTACKVRRRCRRVNRIFPYGCRNGVRASGAALPRSRNFGAASFSGVTRRPSTNRAARTG